MKKVVYLIVLTLVLDVSIAGELAYTCEVKHVYDVDDNGVLKTSNWESNYKRSTFSVSRVTGAIIGEVIPTLLANSTKVINKGNEEYSFNSIAELDAVGKPLSSGGEDAESTASIQLLVVKEFHESTVKPFIAVSMSGAGIVTGICK